MAVPLAGHSLEGFDSTLALSFIVCLTSINLHKEVLAGPPQKSRRLPQSLTVRPRGGGGRRSGGGGAEEEGGGGGRRREEEGKRQLTAMAWTMDSVHWIRPGEEVAQAPGYYGSTTTH